MILHTALRAAATAIVLVAGLTTTAVFAQDQPAADPTATPDGSQAQAAAPAWATGCVAQGRQGPLECTLSQRAITEQGQLVGSVTIRAVAGTAPQMIVSVPLGLYLGAGVSFDVDGANPQKLDLETCDRNGCYAQAALTDANLAAFRAGTKLDIVFQNLNRQPVTLPMSLVGFTAAYDKVK